VLTEIQQGELQHRYV